MEDPAGKYLYDKRQHDQAYREAERTGNVRDNFHTEHTANAIAEAVEEQGADYIVADNDRVPNLVFQAGLDISKDDKDILRSECDKFRFVWAHWFSKDPVIASSKADTLFEEMELLEVEVDDQQKKIDQAARRDGTFELPGSSLGDGGALEDEPKSTAGKLLRHIGLLQLSLEITGLGEAAPALGLGEQRFSQRFGFETVLREGVECRYGKVLGSCETAVDETFVSLQDVYNTALFLQESAEISNLVPEQAYLHFTKYLRKLGVLHEIIRKNSGQMLAERRAKTDGTALDTAAAVAEVVGEAVAIATTGGSGRTRVCVGYK